MKRLWIILAFLLSGLSVRTNDDTVRSFNAENKLFLITLDGLRWQEVFRGADSTLLAMEPRKKTLSATFWSPSPEERRKKLMPFFWTIIAAEGQLYGNRFYGNKMNVANPYALSYPGYNELLTGRVDFSIFNNGKAPNKNITVLDFLNTTESFRGKVAAFASWDAFPYILNSEKSRIPVNRHLNQTKTALTAPLKIWNRIRAEIAESKTTLNDELTFAACKKYILKKKPSVVLLAFGGTDEEAHDKNYSNYLQQAANADQMISELWQLLQTLPEYAGKTTFIITTDHGRGHTPANWHSHGLFVNGSSQTWMALLGNGIEAKGEIKHSKQLYQKNIRELMLKILERK